MYVKGRVCMCLIKAVISNSTPSHTLMSPITTYGCILPSTGRLCQRGEASEARIAVVAYWCEPLDSWDV